MRDRRGRRAKLRKLLDELEAEAAEKSYDAYMARRAQKQAASGKPIRGRRPRPGSATPKSREHANTTDPDSRLLKTKAGYLQGYNAQAVATTDQFVVAAEVTNLAMDAPAYAPMVTSAKRNLRAAGESVVSAESSPTPATGASTMSGSKESSRSSLLAAHDN